MVQIKPIDEYVLKLREELHLTPIWQLWNAWAVESGALGQALSNCYGACYDGDGSHIIAHTENPRRIVKWTRGKAKVWEKSLDDRFVYLNLAYNPHRDTVIGGSQDRTTSPYTGMVSEFSVSTGELIRTLKSTELGPLGRVIQVHPDLDDGERLWLVDYDKHVVVLTDWAGRVYWYFGVYGVSGSDDSHLNYPGSVSPMRAPGDGFGTVDNPIVMIGDSGNHRLLLVRGDKTIALRFPFPYACARSLRDESFAVWSRLGSTRFGTYIFGSLNTPMITGLIETPTNDVRPHPTEPYRMLLTFRMACLEYRFTGRSNPYPLSQNVWSGQAASAGTPIYSPPIPDYFRPKKAVFVKASQTGVLEIEVPRFVSYAGTWDGSWETYDRIPPTGSFPANSLQSWLSDSPLGVFRIKVTLDANGTVDAWLNLHP